MAMNILDKNRLQDVFHLNVEVEADGRGTRALFVVDLQPERVSFAGSEFGRVTPQIPVLELLAIPEAHNQRGPYRLPLATEGVRNEDVRVARQVLLAPVL